MEIDSLIKALEQKINLVSASTTATDLKVQGLDQIINSVLATATATDLALKALDSNLSKSISAAEKALEAEALDNKLKNEIMRDTLKPIDDYIKKLPEKLTKEVKDQLKPLDLRIDAIIESELNI